jgi:DNA-directed RNA polymerase subunit RPC12/RpoP
MDREKVIRAVDSCFNYWLVQHRCLHPLELENVQQLKADAIALLKEQETKYPVCKKCGKKIDHIITSVFNYDGSDSEYSFPITYNEDGGCVQFSTTQNWTGYELSDTEQKDSIRCPFCHEFPFDANEEIELYEPEEVVVMMWEDR